MKLNSAAIKKMGTRAKCRWRGHLLEFVERVPRRGNLAPKNVFRSVDFVGLNGPDDLGLVSLTDQQLIRKVEKIT